MYVQKMPPTPVSLTSSSTTAPDATLNLRKFDMGSIGSSNTVVVLGRRNSGKSSLVRDLLYYHRDIPLGVVVCPTNRINHSYSSFVPSMFIHDEYAPEIVDNLMQRQLMIKEEIAERILQYGSCNIDHRVFFIMDDCGADADSWAKTKQMKNLFMNGRHSDVLTLIALQYTMGIPPDLRGNIDFVFILHENNVSNRRKIWENYAGIFPTFDMFCTVLDQCTEDYEMLVIANGVRSNKLSDCVFWYKAAPPRPFKMCSEQFWVMDAQHRQQERVLAAANRERSAAGEAGGGGLHEVADLSRMLRRRTTPYINVRKTH